MHFEALEAPLRRAFEWLDSMPSRRRVLEVGCGASVLAEKIVEAGFADLVTCVDFSGECVTLMQQRERDRDGRGTVVYECMDATNMDSFSAHSFDFVFDKGTYDAVVTGDDEGDSCPPAECSDENLSSDSGHGSRDDSDSRPNDATRLLAEVRRVIAPKGMFVLVSHSEGRDEILTKSGFRVVFKDAVPNNKATYHCYTCCLD